MTTLRMKNPAASRQPSRFNWLKISVFMLCLLPLARAAWIVLSGMAVNPVEFITRSTGTWTLSFLLITLAISPLRQLSGWSWPLRLRRMLGLYAFFYGCLHFTTYVWLDQFFDWPGMLHDIAKRPFITVGFAAMLLMTPLAITSTQGWMKRLKRNWGRLHRLVYPVALLGVLHYWWLVKKDLTQPMLYASVLAVLLGWRLLRKLRQRSS
ncbi:MULTISPECIES: sulfite oxidase heme-binding subunit YedZ [Aquitalea]|uniref:Protein-methionine-sulfoxide reductase heme-binding subunit MsrQ n=1 Tax=Aquitalea magnusonii TaxID=332411 RepID=A0A318JBF0_9NEIS|nr:MULTISPECIES: protein-methionine-sulfoxide reductase heme-binding subunit MsrQ [Aquitalea]PXX45991.1 sulfoxide reductase heme-binding subunit YedZ [Aquitalea magnusonii]